MSSKKTKQIIWAVLVSLLLVFCSACSGGTGGKPAAKTYTWDDVSFTVKEITDDESVIGDQANNASGKYVAVILDLGENAMSQSAFEGNVAEGKLLLAGKKPANYNYHMSGMVFEGSDFVTKITGETVVFFDMDADYEINEDDLQITE